MRDGQQSVYLHLGGQTTGAEDLVVYLAANRAGLRRAGFGLYCFDVTATGADSLAGAMPAPDAGEAAFEMAARALASRFAPDRKAGEEGFLISAPDFFGPPQDILQGRFFPEARARARLLRRALGQGVDRLVLTVQPYETLFHATWMMMALDRPVAPFAAHAGALAQFQGGWAELGQLLAEELEVREMVIQTAPASAAQSLAQILPGVHLRQPIEPLPKPRLTPSAVAMAQRCLAQGTRLQPGQRDRLVAFHARQPQVRPDYGFSALQLADMRGRYVADLDMLERTCAARVLGTPVPALAAE